MAKLQLTSTEVPREARLARIAERIKQTSIRSYEELCNLQKKGIDMVWNDKEFTPQEIIDFLGVDAVKIFKYHGELTNYVVSVATDQGIAPDIKLPTKAFTVNNGKITVSNQPYQP